MDRDKLAGIARKLIIAVAAVVFCYSAFQLVSTYLGYRQGTEEYDDLEALVFAQMPPSVSIRESAAAPASVSVRPASDSSSSAEMEAAGNISSEAQMTYVDFATLKEMNPGVVAWITLYGTNINYPVVQGEDNDYYLHHTFTGKENAAGAIFIDASIEDGMEGKNVIVYGHNMRNGSMFGTLSYYKNEQMVRNYPTFLVYTENGTYEYAIFSAFMTTAGSDTYIYGFGSDESFMRYVERMKEQSLYDTGVEVAVDDKIMTLSTCSGGNDGRFVVQARRVLPEE